MLCIIQNVEIHVEGHPHNTQGHRHPDIHRDTLTNTIFSYDRLLKYWTTGVLGQDHWCGG